MKITLSAIILLICLLGFCPVADSTPQPMPKLALPSPQSALTACTLASSQSINPNIVMCSALATEQMESPQRKPSILPPTPLGP